MLSHIHGQLWNASKIASSLDIDYKTVQHYLNIFEETFMVRTLQPYHANLKKRLVKSPKVYIRDSGILHLLLGVNDFEDLSGNPNLGVSWEGFVIEQILNSLPESWQSYFFRTAAGAELDLLLFDRKQNPIAIEVKYSLSPVLSKGFWNAFDDLKCKKGYVLYPGKEKYELGKNVYALPLKNYLELFKI